MNDVISRRIPGNSGFGRNSRHYGADVRLRRGIPRVLGISGKREESYGREDGENGYDYDEFDEREASEKPFRRLACRWALGRHDDC